MFNFKDLQKTGPLHSVVIDVRLSPCGCKSVTITTAHPWEVSCGALPFERLSVDLSYRDSSSFRQHTHTVVTKQYTTYSTE